MASGDTVLMAKHGEALSGRTVASTVDFDDVYAAHKSPLYNYICRMIGGDRDLADDLLQETFMKAFRARDRLPDGPGRTPWLYRIATNSCYDVLRRRRLISWLPWTTERGDIEPVGDQGRLGERYAISEGVRDALRTLPASLRAPLLLHVVHGFSYGDIAMTLGISEAAVKMRVSRARAAFRETYRQDGEETA